MTMNCTDELLQMSIDRTFKRIVELRRKTHVRGVPTQIKSELQVLRTLQKAQLKDASDRFVSKLIERKIRERENETDQH